MQNDLSWEIMIKAMWKNQWTQKRSELTDEMKGVLYDASQGIIDIAVKLYAMAQSKVIADRTEMVTVKDIKEVAADNLRLITKMLDALRSGDVRKLAQYEDITPINAQDYIAAQAARIAVTIPEFSKDNQVSLEEQAVFKLLELDIPSKVARSSVRKVISKSVVGQPLSAVVQKAFKLALNMDVDNTQAHSDPQAEDLRNILGDNPYDGFKKSGGIVAVADEF